MYETVKREKLQKEDYENKPTAEKKSLKYIFQEEN